MAQIKVTFKDRDDAYRRARQRDKLVEQIKFNNVLKEQVITLNNKLRISNDIIEADNLLIGEKLEEIYNLTTVVEKQQSDLNDYEEAFNDLLEHKFESEKIIQEFRDSEFKTIN